jgi:hypothetical protein
MYRRTSLAVLVTALLISACVGGPVASGGSSASPGTSGMIAAGLIVSITEEGGSSVALTTRFPDIAIYADGRVIQPGATMMIYPGPLLPSLLQMMVTPAGIQRVLALARTDGLADHDQNYGATAVADMPDATGRHGELDVMDPQNRHSEMPRASASG